MSLIQTSKFRVFCKKIKNFHVSEPMIYLVNYSSLSYVFIILNLFNNHAISVEISIIQGLVALLTLGFSGDIRSIYLVTSLNSFSRVILLRLFLASVLFIISVVFLTGTDFVFILALITKRMIDWIDEIVIHTTRAIKSKFFKIRYFSIQITFILALPFFYMAFSEFMLAYFICWFASTASVLKVFYREVFYSQMSPKLTNNVYMRSKSLTSIIPKQIASTLLINSTNILLRLLISLSFNYSQASGIISSMTIGGFFISMFSNAYLPSIIKKNNKSFFLKNEKKYLFFLLPVVIVLFFSLEILSSFIYLKFNLFFKYIIFSLIGSAFLVFSNYARLFLIQRKKITTLNEDLVVQFLFTVFLLFAFSTNASYFVFASIALGLISYAIYFLRFLSFKISLVNFFVFFTLYFLLFASSFFAILHFIL